MGDESVVIDQRPGLEVNLFFLLFLERRVVEEPVLEPGLVAVFDAITVHGGWTLRRDCDSSKRDSPLAAS